MATNNLSSASNTLSNINNLELSASMTPNCSQPRAFDNNSPQTNKLNNADLEASTSAPKTPADKRREKKIQRRTVRLNLKENHSPVRSSPSAQPQIQPKSIMKKSKKGTPSSRDRVAGQQGESPATTQSAPAPFSFNSPNSPADASFLVRDRKTPSRAHSTPMRPEFNTPKSGRVRYLEKKRLHDITEARKQKITSIVRHSVVVCYNLSQQWQKCKKEGATNLQEFVAEKLDAHGNVTKTLSFTIVTHISDLSEVIKSMYNIDVRLQGCAYYVTDLERTEEDFDEMKPFDTLKLSTIAGMLQSFSDRYASEFQYKKKACDALMQACGHSRPADNSADLLNNILAIWTNDVHIKRKDPHLVALMHEVKGFDDK